MMTLNIELRDVYYLIIFQNVQITSKSQALLAGSKKWGGKAMGLDFNCCIFSISSSRSIYVEGIQTLSELGSTSMAGGFVEFSESFLLLIYVAWWLAN